ncbi:MAG: S8 family serine peptidase, partial [Anaerolineae bacterium]
MAAGGLLLLGAIILYFSMPPSALRHQILPRPPAPPAEFTPPPSLAELVQQYPELAPLLADPELDSAYKQFLIAYQEGGKEAAIDLARRRGLLNDRDEIRVTLFLDTDDPAPLVAQLEGAGIRVVAAYRDTVEIAIPLALIEAAAESENPGALFDQLTGMEHVIAVRVPALHTPQESHRIEGEGIRVIGARDWHRAGFTGAGIRIGVLDMGFSGYRSLLGTELPASVVVKRFGDWDPEEVHGTACAEIIHEIAPDAELFFAWYDGSNATEGEAVDWLLSQGVHIISHSAGAVAGPRDGSGWQAQLVDSVAAQGVLWVNSAGNEAQSHYRALFTDADGDGIHEFGPAQERMALYPYPGSPLLRIFLIWDDVWGRARQDYELYLTNRAGETLASSENVQSGQQGQIPEEEIFYLWLSDETPYVAVKAYNVDRPATLDIFVLGADVAYPSPEYSLVTPADAVGALAVGAAHWRRDVLAEYSSQGPTTDGRLKPEISAPTGVSTASYGDEPFGGTSASAPHVAGAAALVWQAYPEFDRQQVIDFLLAHAVDRGPRGPDTGYGYGRLQLPPPPSPGTPAPPSPEPTTPPPEAPPAGPTTPAPPLLTPTPVPFVTPEPPSPPGTLGPALPMLLVGAMGMMGMGLLLVGTTVWVMGRRTPAPPAWPPSPPGVPPPYPPPVPPAAPEAPPYFPEVPPTVPPPPSPLPSAQCPSCGAPLRPGARFCPRCGQSLLPSAQCPSCGALLRPG